MTAGGTGIAGPEVRAASGGDLPAIAAILAANDEPVEWPGQPGWPYLEHVLASHDLFVAELGGQALGFAGTVRPGGAGGATFLSDLFVRPDAQGRGIGRRLLEAAFDRPGPRATFASADPRALPLYIRFGMLPRWPNLYLDGSADRLPEAAPELVIERVDDAAEIASLFRALKGQDRAADAAYWLGLPGGSGFVARAGGRVAAVGVGRERRSGPGRWLARLAIAAGSDPRGMIPAVLRALAGGDAVGTCVAGPSPVVALLLEAGFRILESDTFCSTEPPLLDPLRDVPDPSLF